MIPPFLVTGPVVPVVTLLDLKEHLRVDFDDEDALIESLEVDAVSHLDGWRGILGRGIMPQTWAQEFSGWGCHKLLLLDASNVVAVGVLGAVETPATEVIVIKTVSGSIVQAFGGPADFIRITYDVSLPSDALPVVQRVVKLLVGHWYKNREAATENSLVELPLAVNSLLAPLRKISI